jgi:hypothetical protein
MSSPRQLHGYEHGAAGWSEAVEYGRRRCAGDPQSRHITAVAGQTGLYFNGLWEAKAQAQAYDAEARRRLQALSLELTGLSAEAMAALSERL